MNRSVKDSTWSAISRFRSTGDSSGLGLLTAAPEGAPVLEALRKVDHPVALSFAISLWSVEDIRLLGLHAFPTANLDPERAEPLVAAFDQVAAVAPDSATAAQRLIASVGVDFLEMVDIPEERIVPLRAIVFYDRSSDEISVKPGVQFGGSKDLAPHDFVRLLPDAVGGLFRCPIAEAGEDRAFIVAALGGQRRPAWWNEINRPAMERLAIALVRAADAELDNEEWSQALTHERPLTAMEDEAIGELIQELLGTRAWNGLAYWDGQAGRRPGLATPPFVDSVDWRIGEWAVRLGSGPTARMGILLKTAAQNSKLPWVDIVPRSGLPDRPPRARDLVLNTAWLSTPLAVAAGVWAACVAACTAVLLTVLGSDWFGVGGPIVLIAGFISATPALWATSVPVQRSRYRQPLASLPAWCLATWVAICWGVAPTLLLLRLAGTSAELGILLATEVLYVLFLSVTQLRAGRALRIAFPTVSQLIEAALPNQTAPPGLPVPDLDGAVGVIEMGHVATAPQARRAA